MEIGRILTDLRAERDRIDKAINAIEALNGKAVSNKATFHKTSTREIKRISAAVRKRRSEAAKKMRKQRRTQAASRPRPAMSAETRKKLSVAAKARWTKQNKKTT
jgi:hypothetical protein